MTRLFLFLSVSLSCLPAFATDNSKVETRTSPSREVEDPRFPSGFSTRVDLKSARDKGGEGLTGALEEVPGVFVRRQSSFGQPAFAQIRGGNPRQLLVLLNGVRVRVPAGLGFDIGSLSLEGIESATLYRGAGAVMFGAGALTGALAMGSGVSQRAPTQVRARAFVGSFGTLGASASGQTSDPEVGAVRGAVSWRTSQGDFPFVDLQGVSHTRINNDHQRLQTAWSGQWADRGNKISSTLLFDQGDHGVAGPSEFQRVFQNARLQERRLVMTSSWSGRDVASGAWGALDMSLSTGFQWRRQRYSNEEALIGGREVEGRSDVFQMEGAWEGALFLAQGHAPRVRVEGRMEILRSDDGETLSLGNLSRKRQTGAVGVFDEWRGFDDQISITGALRLEAVSEGDRSWKPWSPALGAIWRVHPDVQFKANAARTVRVPDFDELYLDTEFVRGDPDLGEERAWVADLGVTASGFRDDASGEARLSGQLVGFAHQIEDMIAFLPVSAYLNKAQNLELVTSAGVEASGRWRAHPRFEARANYTWTRARLQTRAGELMLPHQPEHRAQVVGEVALGSWGVLPAGLDLEVSGAWRSEVGLDNFGLRRNPPWWTLDMGLRYTPWTWLEVRADVRNVMDVRGALDGLQRPLPGRAFFLGVTARQGAP